MTIEAVEADAVEAGEDVAASDAFGAISTIEAVEVADATDAIDAIVAIEPLRGDWKAIEATRRKAIDAAHTKTAFQAVNDQRVRSE